MDTKIFILAVEDAPTMQEALKVWLERVDDQSFVKVCDSIEQAKVYLADIVFDIIFLDLQIRDSQGFSTFYKIKSISAPSTAIILLTGMDIAEATWREMGADGYIKKTALAKKEVVERVKTFLRLKSLSSVVRRAELITGKLNAQGKSNGFTI